MRLGMPSHTICCSWILSGHVAVYTIVVAANIVVKLLFEGLNLIGSEH